MITNKYYKVFYLSLFSCFFQESSMADTAMSTAEHLSILEKEAQTKISQGNRPPEVRIASNSASYDRFQRQIVKDLTVGMKDTWCQEQIRQAVQAMPMAALDGFAEFVKSLTRNIDAHGIASVISGLSKISPALRAQFRDYVAPQLEKISETDILASIDKAAIINSASKNPIFQQKDAEKSEKTDLYAQGEKSRLYGGWSEPSVSLDPANKVLIVNTDFGFDHDDRGAFAVMLMDLKGKIEPKNLWIVTTHWNVEEKAKMIRRMLDEMGWQDAKVFKGAGTSKATSDQEFSQMYATWPGMFGKPSTTVADVQSGQAKFTDMIYPNQTKAFQAVYGEEIISPIRERFIDDLTTFRGLWKDLPQKSVTLISIAANNSFIGLDQSKFEEIIIMGGWRTKNGNTALGYNLGIDLPGAKTLLESGAKITIVPTLFCDGVPVSRELAQRVYDHRDELCPLQKALILAAKDWQAFMELKEHPEQYGQSIGMDTMTHPLIMHDVITAYLAIHPDEIDRLGISKPYYFHVNSLNPEERKSYLDPQHSLSLFSYQEPDAAHPANVTVIFPKPGFDYAEFGKNLFADSLLLSRRQRAAYGFESP